MMTKEIKIRKVYIYMFDFYSIKAEKSNNIIASSGPCRYFVVLHYVAVCNIA